MLRELSTVPEVIEALGGKKVGRQELMRLTGKSTQYVSNWLAAGRLPAWTIWTVSKALEGRGYGAAPTLFGLPAKPEVATEART